MLDKPPVESEPRSWTRVVLFTLVIFCTIPEPPALREAVDARAGREIFFDAGLVLLLALAVQACVVPRRGGVSPGAYLGLAAAPGIFGALIYALHEIPEEALHAAEVGPIADRYLRDAEARFVPGADYPSPETGRKA